MGTQSVESDWNRTRNYKKKRPRGSEEEVYRFEWKVVRSPNGDAQNPAKRIASFRSLRSSLGDANLSFSGRLSTSLAFFRAFCTPMPMRKWQKSLNLEVATPAIVPEMAHSEEFLYELRLQRLWQSTPRRWGFVVKTITRFSAPFQGFLARPRESRNLNAYRFRQKITDWMGNLRIMSRHMFVSCPIAHHEQGWQCS